MNQSETVGPTASFLCEIAESANYAISCNSDLPPHTAALCMGEIMKLSISETVDMGGCRDVVDGPDPQTMLVALEQDGNGRA